MYIQLSGLRERGYIPLKRSRPESFKSLTHRLHYAVRLKFVKFVFLEKLFFVYTSPPSYFTVFFPPCFTTTTTVFFMGPDVFRYSRCTCTRTWALYYITFVCFLSDTGAAVRTTHYESRLVSKRVAIECHRIFCSRYAHAKYIYRARKYRSF